MWPIQLAFRLLLSFRVILCSLTLSNTSSFRTWTDHGRNEEVLLGVKEQRNILYEISKEKANWIGHILRRNCLLQRVIEGKVKGRIEVTRRRGRRRRKLLDDLKERRGYSHLKEEALDRTMWRARFGTGFGSVVRQTTKWNYIMVKLRKKETSTRGLEYSPEPLCELRISNRPVSLHRIPQPACT
jgi:hypothetical protein